MLCLVILYLLHQVGLDLVPPGTYLLFEYSHLFILSSHLFLHVTAESSHSHFEFLHLGALIDNLRKCIADFPLDNKLIIPDLMITSEHFLGALHNFIFKDIETLLKLGETTMDLTFFLGILRITI